MMHLKKKTRHVLNEIKCYQFWKEVRCELLGTFVYVVLGCGTMTHLQRQTGQKSLLSSQEITPEPDTINYSKGQPASGILQASSNVNVALAFGLSAATVVQFVGHVSGGQINPAVSLAMLVTRRISLVRCLAYIVAHTVGSVLASCFLYGITSGNTMEYFLGAIHPSSDVTLPQAFAVELIITFIVVLSYCANLERYRQDLGSPALSIGLCITAAHLFAIYWVGPCLGGILAGFTYEYTQPSSVALASGEACHLRQSFSCQSNRQETVLAVSTSATNSITAFDRCSQSMRSANSVTTMEMTLASDNAED